MLIAKKGNSLINANAAKKSSKYVCAVCLESVVLKRGTVNVAHFAHKIDSNCGGGEPETAKHLMGKQFLLCSLSKTYSSIQLEVYLKKIKQKPDLLANKLAFEYQCSPITNQRLKERVMGYQRLKIESIWILGMQYYQMRLKSNSVRRFMRYHKNIGFFLLFLNSETQKLILKYNIYQSDFRFFNLERQFTNWMELTSFINNNKILTQRSNSLKAAVLNIEKRIINSDKAILKIQELCYQRKKTITGCPVFCHYPRVLAPIIDDWLGITIKIIFQLEINESIAVNVIKSLIIKKNYLFIKNSMRFYDNSILLFLKNLQQHKIISIKKDQIIRIRPIIWYHDTYYKLKMIRKESVNENY
ncbi:competence protein CoiA family protein [Fructilactobacillus vespulae]|uniref:competence protein CoiA n=1 Tax=Fructilactobacillus vespulae TaxID=1249630 RepID=UPI0039B4736A